MNDSEKVKYLSSELRQIMTLSSEAKIKNKAANALKKTRYKSTDGSFTFTCVFAIVLMLGVLLWQLSI